jgi:hypothetical protein
MAYYAAMGYVKLLSLLLVLTVALTSAVVWSRPKQSPGCPKHPPADQSRCGHHHAACSWPCASEGHRSLACDCEQDDKGSWRWQCDEIGPVCTM